MKIKKLLYDYVNQEPRERVKGKFYASEVSSIIGGYLKPEDFYKPRPIKYTNGVVSGMAFEAEFKRILEANKIEFIYEPRYEIIFDDITITTKPDFEFDKKIIETKFPYIIGTNYLERYKYQLELEHQATNKDVFLGIFTHPFNITFYKYEPCVKVFEEIKVALKKFNKRL